MFADDFKNGKMQFSPDIVTHAYKFSSWETGQESQEADNLG